MTADALPPFTVTARWDAEAGVWVSETDIRGLVIETATLDEFEDLVFALAPEMIRDNHLAPSGRINDPVGQTLPVVVWKRPAVAA